MAAASFWQTGSYDPETKLTYWGTGQPVPMFDPEYRPGDNLYTNSTLGLDVDTGKMKWYFQYTPGDFLDYDEIGINQLIDTKINGEDRKIVAHFGRNGFFYTLDRTNGQFIEAEQYAQKINWTDGIDPKTGKPVEYDPKKDLQVYKIGKPSRRAQGNVGGLPEHPGRREFHADLLQPSDAPFLWRRRSRVARTSRPIRPTTPAATIGWAANSRTPRTSRAA